MMNQTFSLNAPKVTSISIPIPDNRNLHSDKNLFWQFLLRSISFLFPDKFYNSSLGCLFFWYCFRCFLFCLIDFYLFIISLQDILYVTCITKQNIFETVIHNMYTLAYRYIKSCVYGRFVWVNIPQHHFLNDSKISFNEIFCYIEKWPLIENWDFFLFYRIHFFGACSEFFSYYLVVLPLSTFFQFFCDAKIYICIVFSL